MYLSIEKLIISISKNNLLEFFLRFSSMLYNLPLFRKKKIIFHQGAINEAMNIWSICYEKSRKRKRTAIFLISK